MFIKQINDCLIENAIKDMLGKMYIFQFLDNLHRYYLYQTLQQFKKVDMERLPLPPCIL